jgi:hypothetical protein
VDSRRYTGTQSGASAGVVFGRDQTMCSGPDNDKITSLVGSDDCRRGAECMGANALQHSPTLLDLDARAVQAGTLYCCHDLLLPLKRSSSAPCASAGVTCSVHATKCCYTILRAPASSATCRRTKALPAASATAAIAALSRPARLTRGSAARLRNVPGQHRREDDAARYAHIICSAERIWVMDRGIPTGEVLTDLKPRALSRGHTQGPAHPLHGSRATYA